MIDRIWVQVADAGRRVPIEGRRAAYFEHDVQHQVRHTPFVQRRIDEGDLVKVDAPAAEIARAAPAPALPIGAPAIGGALAAAPAATASAALATGVSASEKGA